MISNRQQHRINQEYKSELNEPPVIVTGGGYSVDTVISSTDVFGEKSNFIPLTKFGKVIPEF